jgi:hypothetical protein
MATRTKTPENTTPTHDPRTGLQQAMPPAPGHAKAGQPPSRREAGGALPPWLDPANAKWTEAKVAREFGKGSRHMPRPLSMADHPPGPAIEAPDPYRINY